MQLRRGTNDRIGPFRFTAPPGDVPSTQSAAVRCADHPQVPMKDGPAPRLGQPVRPGRADARRHVFGAFSLGAQDQVDPGQNRHRPGQLLRVLDEARQPRPARGLALDDALDQARRLGLQPHEEDLVRADRIQQLGDVGVGFKGLGDEQQPVPGLAV